MSRLVQVLCIGSALAIGITTWSLLRSDGLDLAIGTGTTGAAAVSDHPLAAELRRARRSYDLAAFGTLLERLQTTAAARPADRETWHLLAESCLECALARAQLRGMAVGVPLHTKLSPALAADLERGMAAVGKARELGDDSGELFRIEAGLLSQRITGIASALQWNGRIQEALRSAAARSADNPHLHVALGLRKLLSPKLLGHDPAAALAHFEFAANALDDDERPAMFAAMANCLQQQREAAIAWLERAVARNPANAFARVVLARLRAGEDDPFGRDVAAAEAALTK